jgi:hypothetical protein
MASADCNACASWNAVIEALSLASKVLGTKVLTFLCK